jgi:hypothetical protein
MLRGYVAQDACGCPAAGAVREFSIADSDWEELPATSERVYVRLIGEGTQVLRPTYGLARADGTFTLLPTRDYVAEDEAWEFLPGAQVRCRTEYRDGAECLVAIERVDPP